MSRLVRLLSASTALHTFGRSGLARVVRSCRGKGNAVVPAAPQAESTRFGGAATSSAKRMTSARPAMASMRPVPVTAPPALRSTVRIYQGRSGTTMVGKIDAICRMIDRCIADESAALRASSSEASHSA